VSERKRGKVQKKKIRYLRLVFFLYKCEEVSRPAWGEEEERNGGDGQCGEEKQQLPAVIRSLLNGRVGAEEEPVGMLAGGGLSREQYLTEMGLLGFMLNGLREPFGHGRSESLFRRGEQVS